MRHIKLIAPALVAAASLAGCGGGGGSMSSSSPSGSTPTTPVGTTPTTPAEPQTADFTTTVKEQISATSETSAPMEINDVKFAFKDDDNPTAFDDILPPQTK